MKRLLLIALFAFAFTLPACQCDEAPEVGQVQDQED